MPEHGFLGTRAPFIFDLIVVLLAAILPLLGFSIQQAKQKRYALHKRMQIAIGIALFAAVTAFELELRRLGFIFAIIPKENQTDTFRMVLKIHLTFSLTTPVLWVITITGALIKFKDSFREDYFPTHRLLARLTVADLLLTCATGLLVYYLGFVWSP